MYIYFTASLTGKAYYLKNYRLIIETIKKLGYELISERVLERNPEDVLKENPEEASHYHRAMVMKIKKAEVIIAELSYPSTGVGYEIAIALNEGKPVIGLYVRGKEPYILESSHLEKLQIVEYELDDLQRILEDAIADAKQQMDVRFNFFISPKIGAYLDWISRNKKTPRAVYLRKLIEEDMAGSGYVEKGKKKTE